MIAVLLGLPGSGKGTQAAQLNKQINFSVISTGDIIRKEISKKTPVGLKIESIVNKGHLLNDSLLNPIIQEEILRLLKQNKNIVLDGFPRTVNQAETLEIYLEKIKYKVDYVIEIDAKHNNIINRIINRFICVDCGAIYHKEYKQPNKLGICDFCKGNKFYQRDDDKEEVVRERIKMYQEKTKPLSKYYRSCSHYIKIDGEQKVSKVTDDILKKINKKFIDN